jgi:hypothetical protein
VLEYHGDERLHHAVRVLAHHVVGGHLCVRA